MYSTLELDTYIYIYVYIYMYILLEYYGLFLKKCIYIYIDLH